MVWKYALINRILRNMLNNRFAGSHYKLGMCDEEMDEAAVRCNIIGGRKTSLGAL